MTIIVMNTQHISTKNGQSIDININNRYAVIKYSFDFENRGTMQQELNYEMSIAPNAYISQFIAVINGIKYKGITKEKTLAKAFLSDAGKGFEQGELIFIIESLKQSRHLNPNKNIEYNQLLTILENLK